MPTVTLKVSDEDRQLWVEAAAKELITLSEWLRQAAAARLGSAEAAIGAAASAEPSRDTGFIHTATNRQMGVDAPDLGPTLGEEAASPTPGAVEEKLAEARQLLAEAHGTREFKPDWKPTSAKKKKR